MAGIPCPLCNGASAHYHSHELRDFIRCSQCLSVFLHPKNYISTIEEQAHYETHNNDPCDARYQNFVSPILNSIFNDFLPQHKGLDFGSGTGSPIMKVLEESGYGISQYDLFFHNYKELLQQQYDYIACCETAEHFKQPYKEFKLLRSLLLKGGKLYLMTELFDQTRDFGTWYYKNDPTHVFLYHPKAFDWIREEFGFAKVTIDKRLVVLEL